MTLQVLEAPHKPLLISECFGPTIQGEGLLIGRPTVFVRLGGCDYRCSWCVAPETPLFMADFSHKPAGEVEVGDEIIGVQRKPDRPEAFGPYRSGVVEGVARRQSECTCVRFTDGREIVVAREHAFVMHQSGRFKQAQALGVGERVKALCEPRPWSENSDYRAEYLAGAADGDGSFHSDPRGFRLRGGLPATRALLQEARPALDPKVCPLFERHAGEGEWAQVESVEEVGEREVVSIKTSLGTYVSNGLLSRNCDTLYAVLPEYKSDWAPMSHEQVLARVLELSAGHPILVTLSGGNPALQNLEPLLDAGHRCGCTFALETQGSVSRPWFSKLDFLTLSPKGPSSGMETRWERLGGCIESAQGGEVETRLSLKIVVFDQADYDFAREARARFPDVPFVLQAGNAEPAQPGNNWAGAPDVGGTTRQIEWLLERALCDGWTDVTILPQLHVLLWGNARGV